MDWCCDGGGIRGGQVYVFFFLSQVDVVGCAILTWVFLVYDGGEGGCGGRCL